MLGALTYFKMNSENMAQTPGFRSAQSKGLTLCVSLFSYAELVIHHL